MSPIYVPSYTKTSIFKEELLAIILFNNREIFKKIIYISEINE